MCEHPTEQTARLLTLMAKILQNLSNLQQFVDGGKEQYMIPCDSFISANLPLFKSYIDSISSDEAAERVSDQRLPRFDLRHNVAVMARMFGKHVNEFGVRQRKAPDAKLTKLITTLNRIEKARGGDVMLASSPASTISTASSPVLDNANTPI
jgi:hypothetical protein